MLLRTMMRESYLVYHGISISFDDTLRCIMRFSKNLKQYLAHASTLIFLAGFAFDSFILPSLEDVRARYVGFAYLITIAVFIYVREWLVSRNTASAFEQKAFSVLTFGISYFSGSALAFVFIYTMRSGAFSVSWPLFLVLFICILANEAVSTHNFRFTLDVGVLFVAALFYTVFTLPFLLGVQNDMTFLISLGIVGVAALLYTKLLQHASETAESESPRNYALAIGVPLFAGMLYFLNVIPAVPLSLHDAGVYHYVARDEDGSFSGKREPSSRWFEELRTQTYHLTPYDTGVYFYSAVDAPAELTAPLSHVWEYYDEAQKKWIRSTVISFDLAGGRTDGYRAYSHKENVMEGLWRVTVNVDTNRVVGRVTFKVVRTADVVALEEVKL